MRWRLILRAVFISSLLIWEVGCATGSLLRKPVDPGRQGFLDHPHRSYSYLSGMRDAKLEEKIPKTQGGFRWPLRLVQVTSHYGIRGSQFHEGIDLRAHTGTAVYAAQSGIVLYAGDSIRGYGKMVVIRHRRNLATIYAHNSKLLVKQGDSIKKGQKISLSGNTGHSSGPHLHFEIRSGVAAIDPIRLLPHSVKAAQLAKSGVRPVMRHARYLARK